jgi:hypothetical protein
MIGFHESILVMYFYSVENLKLCQILIFKAKKRLFKKIIKGHYLMHPKVQC